MIQFSETKVVTPEPRQALNAVRTSRRSLAGLELPERVRSDAGRALDEIEDELRIPDPDRGVVTAWLERFTELLTDAGAIEQAGASLVRPIRQIAVWVGPMGAVLFLVLATAFLSDTWMTTIDAVSRVHTDVVCAYVPAARRVSQNQWYWLFVVLAGGISVITLPFAPQP